MGVAILSSMYALMRFTAIVFSVLVFAIVLTACGEAFACGGCVHACCVKTDRPDRRQQSAVEQISTACDKAVHFAPSAASLTTAPLLQVASAQPTPPLLAAKVAQLRI